LNRLGRRSLWPANDQGVNSLITRLMTQELLTRRGLTSSGVRAPDTAVGLTVIFLVKWLTGLGDVVANVAGYAVGLTVSFVLNRRWTFRFEGHALSALLRFVFVFAAAYAGNLLTVLFLIGVLGVTSNLAQTLGIPPYTLLFYAGSRCYAFARVRNTR
jgi:putative flippase GtrA